MSNSSVKYDLELTFDDKTPVNSSQFVQYMQHVKSSNRLPFTNIELYFADEIWDFSKQKKTNTVDTCLKMNFKYIPPIYVDYAKFYVLSVLLNNDMKCQSLYGYLNCLNNFLQYIFAHGVYSIVDISLDIIRDFCSRKTENRKRYYTYAIRSFLVFYSVNIEKLELNDIFNYFEDLFPSYSRTVSDARKIPDIDDAYFDNLVQALLKVINSNEPADQDYKGIAAFLLLHSQTGLHISELLSVKIDSLMPFQIYDGFESHYLKYPTWKRVRSAQNSDNEKMYLSPLGKLAFESLLETYRSEHTKIDYLYVGRLKDIAMNRYPIQCNVFHYDYIKFFYYLNKYFPTLDPTTIPPGFGYKYLNSLYNTKKYNNSIVVYPSTMQFRVHMCTDLYRKGVPLDYIERFMSHLSEKMRGYYVRIKSNTQENADFSEAVLEKIVAGKIEPLGPNATILSQRINEYIEKNHLSVKNDLYQICNELAIITPIRQKTGGVCIKASFLRDCSIDAKTNELFCSYGVCPNIFHFYYMADITYRQMKQLKDSIKLNKKHGFIRDVEKESNMLQTLVTTKLIPELDSLKHHLESDGRKSIEEEYPDLIEIIDNLPQIYNEALQYKRK